VPTTVLYNFPYPALSDAPSGPVQIQALAQAVENKIATVDSALSLTTLAPAVQNQLLFNYTVVSRSTNQAITTSAETLVQFIEPAAGDDQSDMFSVVNNTRVTMKLAGTYEMKFNCSLATGGASTYRACRMRLNGTTTILDSRFMSLALAGTPFHLCGERRFALNDYIEVLVYHENGTTLDIDVAIISVKLTVRRVGP
jgi:hypothetical protein